MAHQLAHQPATIHTHCLNVHRAMKALPYVNAESPYAGIMAEISRRNKHKDITLIKV